jgi:Domain of unknown function (DUF4160)
MYHNDHAPPHVHAKYAEHKAKIDIATGELIEGYLPNRVLLLLREWVALHATELGANWELIMLHRAPRRIEPLE